VCWNKYDLVYLHIYEKYFNEPFDPINTFWDGLSAGSKIWVTVQSGLQTSRREKENLILTPTYHNSLWQDK